MQLLWCLVLACALPLAGCGKRESETDAVAKPSQLPSGDAPERPGGPTPVSTSARGSGDKGPGPASEASADTAPAPDTGEETRDEAASGGRPDAPSPGAPYLLDRAEGLRISGLVLARGIDKTGAGKRVPVDPGHAFVRDDRRVYAIMDLENPAEVEGELTVGWIKPGSETEGNAVTVSVKPSKTWRTWAFNKYVSQFPGVWQVVVRDSDGAVLARAAFEMKE